jgi:hypothetical protein
VGKVMLNKGLTGTLFLAIGGTIVFALLIGFFSMIFHDSINFPLEVLFLLFSFIGFFMVGLGLWVIAGNELPYPFDVLNS